MTTESVTLEEALRLLSLPRLVGADPESGEEITAQNGRYGPYLKKGTDSRSLTSEEQLFTVTLDEALEIYAQPKQRGRRTAAAAPPLRELGTDPATKKPMVIKDGRFGPYVTDGETNASPAQGRRGREAHRRARRRAAGRAPGPRPGPEEAEPPAEARRPQEGPSQVARPPYAARTARSSGYASAESAVRAARQASSRAFTAAATRPPSARPAAAALARFMTWPICRGPGCSPSSAAVSSTAVRAIAASSSSVSWVGR